MQNFKLQGVLGSGERLFPIGRLVEFMFAFYFNVAYKGSPAVDSISGYEPRSYDLNSCQSLWKVCTQY